MEDRGNTIALLMEEAQRELAMLASDTLGAQAFLGQFGRGGLDRRERRELRDLIETSPLPYMIIDPRPGLRIVDMNETFAAETITKRHRAAGEKLFDVFPDNPADIAANGMSRLYESIRQASQTGKTHAMAVQRYDVRDEAGRFVERYWRPTNTPIFDDAGRLLYLLHYSEVVTPR